MHIGSIGRALKFFKTELLIDSKNYVLAHLPNGAVLVTKCFPQLAENRIERIGALDGLSVLPLMIRFQVCSYFMELPQPLLQVIVRPQSLYIEVALLLDQEGQDSLEFLILVSR